MDSRKTTTRQYSEYSDFFQHNEYESTIKIQTSLGGSPLRSDGMDETGDANRTLVWVTHRTTGRGGQTMIGHSHSGQNSRRAANVEREVGQPSIVYLKRQLYTETVGGISHGSVPWLRPTGRIVRRLVVTFQRAMQLGLRRTDIQTTTGWWRDRDNVLPEYGFRKGGDLVVKKLTIATQSSN